MRPAALLLGLLLADSSGRAGPPDLARFDLLRSFGPVHASALSPAGDRVAVYSGASVKLVDVREGKEVHVLRGHTAQIHDSGWSADGQVFATCGYDGTVRIWHAATGREIACLERPHPGYACSVGVSPDGKHAATGGSRDGWVRVFETATGRQVRAIDTGTGATHTLGFTGDGRFLVGSHGDGSLRVWNPADGSAVRILAADAGYVPAFSFSRDGKLAAYPVGEGAIAIVETSNWSEVRRLEGHEEGTQFSTFHPRGRALASLGSDGVIRFWDLATGRRIRDLAPEEDAQGVRLAFTADGQCLVAPGVDGTVRVYGVKR